MIVPVPWFVFFNSLEIQIDRAGSLERALVQFRDNLPEKAKVEVRNFLKTASQADEEDCMVLSSLELERELIIETDESCREYYSKILAIFDS